MGGGSLARRQRRRCEDLATTTSKRSVGSRGRGGDNDNDVDPRGEDDNDTNLMGLCAQNQTCANFGYPSNALEYVLLDGIWLESKTSWTKNAQTAVRLVRHPHILIGAQTKAAACYSRKVSQSFLHGCIKTIVLTRNYHIGSKKKHSSEAPELLPRWSRRAGSAPRMSGWRRVGKT
jgi:hypothetical protein